MALTDTAIKHAKPAEKPRKLFDGSGLYLLLTPDQGKYWRLKYRFGGKEKSLSFGVYPEVTLAAARNLRDEARALLAEGVDPSEVRKEERAMQRNEAARLPDRIKSRLSAVRKASSAHRNRRLVSSMATVCPLSWILIFGVGAGIARSMSTRLNVAIAASAAI